MSKVFTITNGLENLGAFRTGGQGSVYKARRIGEIITAVKLLPTPIHTESTDNKPYADFRNEVEKLKKVNEHPNPNVVKILSSGLTDSGSFPFIEMEYIEGPDLEELLKPPYDPVFTIKETIKVAEHLANALSHCHAVNVKHGDVKSNNVKYNARSGNYVLLDFGLAIMSDEQRRTSMRQAGAIEFMAPEQYEGLMLFESDIYSFGVILFELLTGQVPFPLIDNGETARNNVRLSHLEVPIPDIVALRRQSLPQAWTEEKKEREMLAPDWLLEILCKCLSKRPEDRFTHGMALKDAITRYSIAGINPGERLTGTETNTQYKQLFIAKEEELERLKKIYTVQGRKKYSAGIFVPLPVLFTSVLFLFILLGYAGYTVFQDKPDKPHVRAITDTSNLIEASPVINASMSHPDIPKKLMSNVVLNIDSIKNAEKQKRDAAIARARQKEARQKAIIAEDPPKEKKKRKKFLIF